MLNNQIEWFSKLRKAFALCLLAFYKDWNGCQMSRYKEEDLLSLWSLGFITPHDCLQLFPIIFSCCLAVFIELNLRPSPIPYFPEAYGWGANIQLSKLCIFYWPVLSWSKLGTNSGCARSSSSTAWRHISKGIGASPLWVISYPSIQKFKSGMSCASPEKDDVYFPLWYGSQCSFLQTGVQEHRKR